MAGCSEFSETWNIHGIVCELRYFALLRLVYCCIRLLYDTNRVTIGLILVPSWSPSGLGKWQIAMVIAVPIGFMCVLVIATFLVCFFCKWNSPAMRYHYSENGDAPDQQPILGVSSIRDMIEMTTSGSGSGLRIYFLPYIYIE